MLPTGRVAWLRLAPGLASSQTVNHLLAAVEQMDRRRTRAIRAGRGAARELARAIVADAARLSRTHRRRHRRLRRRVARGDARLDARATAQLAELAAARRRAQAREEALAGILQRRLRWDQLTVASALPLFAAFGQAGEPLAENNVALALLLLVWLLGEEITGVLSGDRRDPAKPLRDVDLWSYVAPFANLFTGWFLLHDKQNERIVSGTASLLPDIGGAGEEGVLTYRGAVDLVPLLAPERAADLEGASQVPVIASVMTQPPAVPGRAPRRPGPVAVSLAEGELTLTVNVALDGASPDELAAELPAITVGWMFDAGGL